MVRKSEGVGGGEGRKKVSEDSGSGDCGVMMFLIFVSFNIDQLWD